jgi:hypothetical protein
MSVSPFPSVLHLPPNSSIWVDVVHSDSRRLSSRGDVGKLVCACVSRLVEGPLSPFFDPPNFPECFLLHHIYERRPFLAVWTDVRVFLRQDCRVRQKHMWVSE